VDNTPQSATILSSKKILFDTAFDTEPGNSISINLDGFYYKFIVDNIDVTKTKIILTEEIYDEDGYAVEDGIVTVKRTDNKTVKLLNLEEGHYLIKPGNIKLVVRESYLQPEVTFSQIAAVLIDATNLKQSRLSSLNKVAIKMIYSDLSAYENYYDIIDEIDLWKMLFIKIQCLLVADYEIKQEFYNPCLAYEKLLMTYKPREKFNENEDGSSSEQIEEPETASWIL